MPDNHGEKQREHFRQLRKDIEPLLGVEVRVEEGDHGPWPPVLTPAPGSGLENPDRAIDFFQRRRLELRTLLDLCGVALMRGFGISTTEQFSALFEDWPDHELGYAGGGSPRPVIKGRVMESTRYRADVPIPLHQEMAYLPHFPQHIAFWCRVPSPEGGETPLADMRLFTSLLPSDIREIIERKGIWHGRWYPAETMSADDRLAERSWQEAFYTNDRAEAEKACRSSGMDYQWLEDGSLQVEYTLKGFETHPRTGDQVWFNSIHIMTPSRRMLGDSFDIVEQRRSLGKPVSSDVSYGDGSPIPEAHLDAIFDCYEKFKVEFQWQVGDVVIADNYLTAHGRTPFSGPREIQVTLFG